MGVLVSRFACDKIEITWYDLVAVAGDAAGLSRTVSIHTLRVTYKVMSLPFSVFSFFSNSAFHKLKEDTNIWAEQFQGLLMLQPVYNYATPSELA